MNELATARIADATHAAHPNETDCASPINVTLTNGAAFAIGSLSRETGVPIERLLATSIQLLRIAIEARKLGRRLAVTTWGWWPVKEVAIHKF
jgi:hypothetical protein